MNKKFVLLAMTFLLASLLAAGISIAEEKTIYSSKSGFLSDRFPTKGFSNLGTDHTGMIYYKANGLKALGAAVHYEWFDLSSIPNGSKIVSAKLYKYHDSSLIGRDKNYKMDPKSVLNANRVLLGKLDEPFKETDTYKSQKKYKSAKLLDKVATATSDTPALVYDVTEVAQAWVGGEPNYGFEFLGNYNSNQLSGTRYYFSNAPEDLKPKMVISYVPSNNSTNNTNSTNLTNCGNSIIDDGEECDDGNLILHDGCSDRCKNEPKNDSRIYIINYLGDIDGSINPVWFPFYGKISKYYQDNALPVSFSFFPATMSNDSAFEDAFRVMYENPNLELIQKGYIGDDKERNSDTLSYEEQKEIAQYGLDAYKKNIQEIYNNSNLTDIKKMVTYDLLGGNFNSVTLQAIKDLGFNTYFDVYVGSHVNPTSSTADFDVIQYGISFSTTGGAGSETEFKPTHQIIAELMNYTREDIEMMTYEGHKVVPLYAHQQDFEIGTNGTLNEAKWAIYTQTIENLSKDPNFVFITSDELFRLRHAKNSTDGEGGYDICQYASSAQATSENSDGSMAKYASGEPDAKDKTCEEWSGYGYSWTPEAWNKKATLTLHYDTPIYVKNLSVFGDYDVCWDRIWLKNSQTGKEKQIYTGPGRDCLLSKTFTDDFIADTVVLETCGWGWTSTDAVQMCGKSDSPIPNQTTPEIEICKWKNCEQGAVSVSVDDSYISCMDKLEDKGYRGTYFLSNTDTFNKVVWGIFNDAYKKGHEIGTHTQHHWCYYIDDETYVNEVNANIQDILTNTETNQADIISHAYPCGYASPAVKTLVKNNWNYLAGRGYNYNELEESTPKDYFELRSYNSHEYPGGSLEPPNYFTAVDEAEAKGKWLNMVFHIDCSDDGVISYLPSKSVWVDTIGNVARYTNLRDTAAISDLSRSDTEIKFKVASNKYESFYNQELTMRVIVSKKPLKVEVNGLAVDFRYITQHGINFIIFNVPFPIQDEVRVVL